MAGFMHIYILVLLKNRSFAIPALHLHLSYLPIPAVSPICPSELVLLQPPYTNSTAAACYCCMQIITYSL